MNKQQQNHLTRVKRAIEIIQQTAPLEMKRESRGRRRNMSNAYDSMQTHGRHLGITVPKRTTSYNPEKDLEYANSVLVEVNKLYDESNVEKAQLNNSGFRLMK